MTRKEQYKNLLAWNAYIDLPKVLKFLKEGSIADYEVVSQIYNNGMCLKDFEDLQEVIEEIENGEIE